MHLQEAGFSYHLRTALRLFGHGPRIIKAKPIAKLGGSCFGPLITLSVPVDFCTLLYNKHHTFYLFELKTCAMLRIGKILRASTYDVGTEGDGGTLGE